jgi:ferric-dicitrate binding protein FerR (iron transport regulator)
MRLLYASPRHENIDRVIALMAEHGIATTVTNRSNWNRPSYQRFSYARRNENRDAWPQVWIERADDYARARELLRGLGIEPAVRHAEELAQSRNPSPLLRRQTLAVRVRRLVLLALGAAFVLLMLRYFGMLGPARP